MATVISIRTRDSFLDPQKFTRAPGRLGYLNQRLFRLPRVISAGVLNR